MKEPKKTETKPKPTRHDEAFRQQAVRMWKQSGKSGELTARELGIWDRHKHEFAVYVTNLPDAVNGWQIQELYRRRADPENVFDELKNQWGFSGFCAKSRATTELAARLLLMVYNLWTLSVRLIVPHPHTEAKRGRRWFLLLAARLAQSGRQKEIQVSSSGGWAQQLRDGYLRLHEWIRTTAPQLKSIVPQPDPATPNPAPAGV
jgi:hypothetical protein